MFGMGGFGATQEATQASPEKKRQEDNQTCMPATVRLVLDAQKIVEDKGTELQLHGAEVANVTLVGVVEGLVKQETMTEFTLNDGTGRVKVRHYLSAGIGGDAGKDDIVAGCYASIVGSLRTSPAVHISALTLRPVKNGDEVSYHMIEVAHSALTIKKGGTVAPAFTPTAPASQMFAGTTTTPATVAPVAAAQAAVGAAAPAANLREKVLEVLRAEGESRPEGVPLAVLLERLKSSPAAGVREALQKLVTDGEAFTTIDDDHFSPI